MHAIHISSNVRPGRVNVGGTGRLQAIPCLLHLIVFSVARKRRFIEHVSTLPSVFVYILHCIYGTIYTTIYTLHCIHHTVYTALYILQYIHYTVYTTLYMPHCIFRTMYTALYKSEYMYRTVYTTLYIVQRINYTV